MTEVPELPLVTIVTPSYNMARFLPAAIESVLSQDYPRIEYLVKDACSTDGTLAVLERHAASFRYTTIRDSGPAEAIRNGFREARGEILAWLNADDAYEPGAVRRAVKYLAAHPEVDVVYGDGWWIDEDGRRIRPYPTRPFDAEAFHRECFLCQPAVFFRARAYQDCEIDTSLKTVFDYDLWIRMAAAGRRFAYLQAHLANTRMHRETLTLGSRELVFRETLALLGRHYGYVPFPWLFGYAAYLADGRDQFLEPLRPSFWKYLRSLPLGLSYNRGQPFRFLADWVLAPWRPLLSGRGSTVRNHPLPRP
ncbi:MAG TPA: glycosyltransferase family 2 protein [Bryobacteraceae bacterium]|nr:glycosyltransferase family 2 protein [Bryobacteraceae bacterium]